MKEVRHIRNRLDSEKIREILCDFLDNHNFLAPTEWAIKMKIGPGTLFSFIHGARKARRATLISILDFIDDYKKKENETAE